MSSPNCAPSGVHIRVWTHRHDQRPLRSAPEPGLLRSGPLRLPACTLVTANVAGSRAGASVRELGFGRYALSSVSVHPPLRNPLRFPSPTSQPKPTLRISHKAMPSPIVNTRNPKQHDARCGDPLLRSKLWSSLSHWRVNSGRRFYGGGEKFKVVRLISFAAAHCSPANCGTPECSPPNTRATLPSSGRRGQHLPTAAVLSHSGRIRRARRRSSRLPAQIALAFITRISGG